MKEAGRRGVGAFRVPRWRRPTSGGKTTAPGVVRKGDDGMRGQEASVEQMMRRWPSLRVVRKLSDGMGSGKLTVGVSEG